jgi:hypothetical protein
MVRENLIQNVSQDRKPCRINSVITGIFAEILCNAEGIAPEEEKTNGGSVIKETAGRGDCLCFLKLFEIRMAKTESVLKRYSYEGFQTAYFPCQLRCRSMATLYEKRDLR